jgi:hypothetical protein
MRHGTAYLQEVVPEILQRIREFGRVLGRVIRLRDCRRGLASLLRAQIGQRRQFTDFSDLLAGGF